MSDIVIQAEGLGKRYRIGELKESYKTLCDSMTNAVGAPFRRAAMALRRQTCATNKNNSFWALKDASFEVQRGEVVGIIGRNGAGKTTLLKILSRITTPTDGLAKIHGRVGSLLEVGTGFHPELTGRENVYFNGSILGMKRREIEDKFDEIVKFSGVEKFLDTPLKRYSSGMQVRLAFAVAAHLDPEILLVDEVLAVGDYKFQEKCLGKMQEITGEGRTVLFVSHNMKAISEICTRVILLNDGQIQSDGDTKTVIREYTGGEQQDVAEISWPAETAPRGDAVKLLKVQIRDENDKVKSIFKYTEPISICVTFLVLDDTVDMYPRIYLTNEDDVLVLSTTALDNPHYNKGIHEAKYTILPHFLSAGRYSIAHVLFKEGLLTSENIAWVQHPVGFYVEDSGRFTGGVMKRVLGVIEPDWDWEITEIHD